MMSHGRQQPLLKDRSSEHYRRIAHDLLMDCRAVEIVETPVALRRRFAGRGSVLAYLGGSRACGISHSGWLYSPRWSHLLRSHLLPQLGDIDGSSRAVMQAPTMFIRLGQGRGLIAMQRIRKGGLSSLLA